MSKMYISNLVCECCSNVFPVPRKQSERRGRGHVKHIWCYKCMEVTAHVEQAVRYAEKETLSM